jgi:D-alanyl-D-alanine carboxypeptidase
MPTMKTVTGLALLAASLVQPAADWTAWLDARTGGFSGAVLVATGDAVTVARAYGLADQSAKRPNTPDTRFNIGSINKTFTAMAIAQLIQQGKLSLDDPLAKHLPEYPNQAAAAKITIRDLITHRAGVAQFMGGNFGEGTVAEMAKLVGNTPQAFDSGTQQQYSNGGYVVLGRVVEVLSGKSYSDYVAEHIYKPSGMTSTGFVKAGAADQSVAKGPSKAVAPGNPAGGGYSTVTDLFRFSRALRAGQLLDARMTDLVLNGTFSGESGPKFGFALREQSAGTRRFVGNGGGAPGINAEFRFEPAGDHTVVVLANMSPPAATDMLRDILNRLP